MIGIHTRELAVEAEEKKVHVHVNYALDVNGDQIADCNIEMNVKAWIIKINAFVEEGQEEISLWQ